MTRDFVSLSGAAVFDTVGMCLATIERVYVDHTNTAIRNDIVYFKEVRRDWRPPNDRCRLDRFAGWAKREVEAPVPERRVRPLPEG